jgi:hypothetical protein
MVKYGGRTRFLKERKGAHKSLFSSRGHGAGFATVQSRLPKSTRPTRQYQHKYRKRRKRKNNDYYRTRTVQRGPPRVKMG